VLVHLDGPEEKKNQLRKGKGGGKGTRASLAYTPKRKKEGRATVWWS